MRRENRASERRVVRFSSMAEQFLREGIAYAQDIPVAPNAVEVRVIVRDEANGKIGGVTVPIGSERGK